MKETISGIAILYVIMTLVLVFGILLLLLRTASITYSAEEAIWIQTYTKVIGIIYALVAVFAIAHVWTNFNSLTDKITKEISHLRNIRVIGEQISSKFSSGLSKLVNSYIESNIGTFWGRLESQSSKNKKFSGILGYISKLKPRSGKELSIFNRILEELRMASEARPNIRNFSIYKTPGLVWILLVFLSVVFILSIALMSFNNIMLSIFVVLSICISVGLVMVLIYNLDMPFQRGFWMVTPKKYIDPIAFVQRT